MTTRAAARANLINAVRRIVDALGGDALKYNENHDELGRFAESDSGGSGGGDETGGGDGSTSGHSGTRTGNEVIDSALESARNTLASNNLGDLVGDVKLYNDPSDANFMAHTGELRINMAHLDEAMTTQGFSDNAQRMSEGKVPNFATTSISDCVLHEAGHAFMREQSREFRQEELPNWYNEDKNSPHVFPSFYGQDNYQEAYAETFVRVLTNKPFNGWVYTNVAEQVAARSGKSLPPSETKSYDELYSRLYAGARRLFNGGKDANFLATFARSIDAQLTEAWNDGADDMGVAPDEMTESDMSILNGIIDSENNYIQGLADDIQADKAAGMTLADFESKYGARCDLWANRYTETVNEAHIRFGGKQKLQWNLGATEVHCDACQSLDGIIAFADEWAQAGVKPQNPPNQMLGCDGWRCDCRLEPTDKRRSPRALDTITEIALTANGI
jgi:hypothetical protein